ncbi:MAG: dihydrolipoyl dehydrogenase [Bacteroidetes bacterium]|nr:MAG: dihydrolipoyl dehydrogenase [Bacteroidota bacterium]
MVYDVVIIGSGPGGYVAALHAAHNGLRVAVVEREHLGGVCLNWGCIPTKALLQSAHACDAIRNAADFGIRLGPIEVDMERVVGRSREVAGNMSKGVKFLLDRAKVEIIEGAGSLLSATEVKVLSADGVEQVLKAKDIIIATGARARAVPSLPVDGERIIAYREALSLGYRPDSMAIVGSGAIGCEMAEFYAALGTKVTLIEAQAQLMPLVDDDVASVVGRVFRRKKVKTMTSAMVQRVDVSDEGCVLHVETKKGVEEIEAQVVLSAVGIQPNTENLGLEALGVEMDRGRIVTSLGGATNVPHVYAIGDVCTTPALAHVASVEGAMAVDAILGRELDASRMANIPSCTYTTPEVASVGLTERQLKEQGVEYFVGKFPFTASGKATAMGHRDGFVKLLFRSDSRQLAGAHIIGANATELIGELCLALHYGSTPEGIYETMHAHPTLSECVMEAAAQADGVAHHV